MGSLILDAKSHLGGFPFGKGVWEPALWQWAITTFAPGSMLDVGCGRGFAALWFKEHNVTAVGVDGSTESLARSPAPELIHLHDYTVGPYLQAADLIWSAEFVEHVEEKYADNFLATFAGAVKVLLMTHAVPGQGGHHHVNCQSAEYWQERLARHGLRFDQELTSASRNKARKPGRGWGRSGLVFVPA